MSDNKDRQLLGKCIISSATALFDSTKCEHPLDNSVVNVLKKLHDSIDDDSDDFRIFRFRQEIINPLWCTLIEKAIKCLRYYDTREPFNKSDGKKSPKAYGVTELKKYYNDYIEFEQLLYGSNRYYRDHVVHVFRTWLSGVVLLVKNNGKYLDMLSSHGRDYDGELAREEKLSMWTLIALTHDLGYPLQKAKRIIDATRNMVATFVSNPDISMDLSFHGVQNYMNDFIVRLMSSKMRKHRMETEVVDGVEKEVQVYVARLQPKYYFKFQKSLEGNSHGILSTLIIYKLLTYFLESDYSINEDYIFFPEDQRQFFIRREILRSIASHTCNDVYQLYMTSFSFLLRICDDTQDWGRKSISELYATSTIKYQLEDIDLHFDGNDENPLHSCTINEKFSSIDDTEAVELINRLRNQSLVYMTIFRDGQDTARRDFSFKRKLIISFNEVTISLELNIAKDSASQLTGRIDYPSDDTIKETLEAGFFENVESFDWKSGLNLFDRSGNVCGTLVKDSEGKVNQLKNHTEWSYGEFAVLLTS